MFLQFAAILFLNMHCTTVNTIHELQVFFKPSLIIKPEKPMFILNDKHNHKKIVKLDILLQHRVLKSILMQVCAIKTQIMYSTVSTVNMVILMVLRCSH